MSEQSLNIWEKALGWRKRQMIKAQIDNDVPYTGKHIGKEIPHCIDPPRPTRNEVLEEVAKEFDGMKNGGNTTASFAAYVRSMKR